MLFISPTKLILVNSIDCKKILVATFIFYFSFVTFPHNCKSIVVTVATYILDLFIEHINQN